MVACRCLSALHRWRASSWGLPLSVWLFLQGIVADRRLRGDLWGDDIILGWCSFPGQILFFCGACVAFGSSASSVSWRLWAFSEEVSAMSWICSCSTAWSAAVSRWSRGPAPPQRSQGTPPAERDPGPAGADRRFRGAFPARMAAITPSANPSGTGGIFNRWEGGPDGLDVIHIDRQTPQVSRCACTLRLRRRQLAVHVQVQQGRKFLTGIHLSALLS